MMTITQKSTKQFRFSLVDRMQGCRLDIAEELYCTIDRGLGTATGAPARKAMVILKLLSWVVQVSL